MLAGFVTFVLCGTGVTVGAHRFYTHRSFKGNFALQCILMTLFTMAGQVRAVAMLVCAEFRSIVGLGTVQKARRSRVRFPMSSLQFYFKAFNPSSRTMALGLSESLTERNTGIFPGE
jgi:hypothetical protein